jgi:hypothetical protein
MGSEPKPPKFDPSNLEILAYIKGDPKCPKCYGKGYMGVMVDGVVIRCKCAVITSPLIQKVLDRQDELHDEQSRIFERLEGIERGLGIILDQLKDNEKNIQKINETIGDEIAALDVRTRERFDIIEAQRIINKIRKTIRAQREKTPA